MIQKNICLFSTLSTPKIFLTVLIFTTSSNTLFCAQGFDFNGTPKGVGQISFNWNRNGDDTNGLGSIGTSPALSHLNSNQTPEAPQNTQPKSKKRYVADDGPISTTVPGPLSHEQFLISNAQQVISRPESVITDGHRNNQHWHFAAKKKPTKLNTKRKKEMYHAMLEKLSHFSQADTNSQEHKNFAKNSEKLVSKLREEKKILDLVNGITKRLDFDLMMIQAAKYKLPHDYREKIDRLHHKDREQFIKVLDDIVFL